MSQSKVDADLVRELAGLLSETGLTEIEYRVGSIHVRVARQAAPAAMMVPSPAAVAQPAAGSPGTPAAGVEAPTRGLTVSAPMVGVVYLASEPGASPFVKPGDSVSEGQTLLLIEAMKTFNPVRAPKSGKILQIMIADGTAVEYGEPLVVIE